MTNDKPRPKSTASVVVSSDRSGLPAVPGASAPTAEGDRIAQRYAHLLIGRPLPRPAKSKPKPAADAPPSDPPATPNT